MARPPADDVVCVVGAGYVGLVTGICLADSGRTVHLVEIEPRRLERLAAGGCPIHEPGLEEMLQRLQAAGRVQVTGDIAVGVRDAGIVMIAVGTPPAEDGEADLSQVRDAVASAAANAARGAVIAIKSTIPPGTTASMVASRLAAGFPLVSCPEFLREGSAIDDFNNPTRIVVGGDDRVACDRVAALFGHLHAPVIITDSTSAEMVKYGTNTFLALKISFINEIAHLCELTGAEVGAVADGMGLDPRVGRAFLNAGLGFGGSCFPKDVRALEAAAAEHGHSFWMLKSAIEVNLMQRRRFVTKVRDALGGSLEGSRLAVLGLAFKPGTDDLRQAPALDVIRHLERMGATVTATDPAALEGAAPLLAGTTLVADAYDCVRGSDAVVLVTEWPCFRELDWHRVAQCVARRIVVDGRNCLDAGLLARLGFAYHSVGRRALLPD
ncbi:MAG: UDP-glucose/GDP-mannose dehydrogenase family protein [Chloroflexi bacterium]|nr:MAG: UDP-glucose/GDP-mannose dehydrogenase family protein [Chloroflexota bacterium]